MSTFQVRKLYKIQPFTLGWKERKETCIQKVIGLKDNKRNISGEWSKEAHLRNEECNELDKGDNKTSAS